MSKVREEKHNIIDMLPDSFRPVQLYRVGQLVGQLKEVIEAVIPEGKQQEAVKNIIADKVYEWYHTNLWSASNDFLQECESRLLQPDKESTTSVVTNPNYPNMTYTSDLIINEKC